jgi:hypothetical protein
MANPGSALAPDAVVQMPLGAAVALCVPGAPLVDLAQKVLNEDVRVDVAHYDAPAQVLTLTISSERVWDPGDKAVLAAATAGQFAVKICADVVMADVLGIKPPLLEVEQALVAQTRFLHRQRPKKGEKRTGVWPTVPFILVHGNEGHRLVGPAAAEKARGNQ